MSGQPDLVDLLATRVSNLARDVDSMHDKFKADYLGGIWSGPAFEAFAKTLEDVPNDLGKVSTSYRMASTALRSYGHALEEVQRRGRDLATQASDAESRVNTAEGDRVRAKREVKLAKSAQLNAADPVALSEATRRLKLAVTALSAAETRHAQANSDVATINTNASNAVAAFQAEVRLCCQRLHDASEAGIQNTPLSWYDRNVADGPIGILLSPLTDLAKLRHIIDLVKNPGDLAAWRELMDGFGAVLTIALVVTVLVFPPALIVVAPVTMAGGVLVAGASLGIDLARVNRGEISEDALIWDSVALGFAAVPVGRTYAPRIAKALKTSDQGWVKRYLKYGTSGRRPTPTLRYKLEELRDEAITAYGPKVTEGVLKPIIPPANVEPCVAPSAGLTAGPVGVVRHVRQIEPRPIVLADVA